MSKNSQDVIKKYLLDRDKDSWIFVGNKSHYTKLPITQKQYSRIVKRWVSLLGVEDTSDFSTHSLRKTQSPEICRRLLGHANLSATSSYLGIEDSDAILVARNHHI